MRTARPLTLSLARLSAAALAVGVVGTLPVITPSGSAPRSVPSHLTSIAVSGVDTAALARAPRVPAAADGPSATSAPTRVVAMTPERSTAPFRVLGVTWRGSAAPDLTAWVRTRHAGAWSPWQEVHSDASHAPDPGTAEAAHERGGTEPLIVEPSDGVQLRVDSAAAAPQDLALDLVDPGTSPADASVGQQPPASAQASGSRPAVYTRAQWGADESLRRANPEYGTIRVGFVHHTAGSNTYTQADVPAIIRGIYAYHVNGRGWNDIGYNFLVDKYGRMWEGRYGGMDKPVIGAHTGGYNSQSFAMSALGTFNTTVPPSAMLTAYNKLYAWKLSLHRVDPLGSTVMTDADGYPTRTYRNISGHRDYNDGSNNTECPGDALYAKINGIRSAARSLQGTMFYSPRASKTSWSYGTAGATLTATASKTLTWKVAITSPCATTTVRTLTGTGTASGGISAVWDGKAADGTWARPGTYDLTLTATNGSGTLNNAPPWTVRVTVLPTATSPEGLCPERIGGSNRYAVSVAVSRLANPTATTIVVANGTEAAMGDALVSGPLARSKKAALLLTYASTLPPEVSAEITRRKATTAFLVGGTGSVSTNVVTQLRALGITAVTRYDGVDRFEVAANVARAIAPSSPDVMVASGRPAAMADGLVLSGPAAGLVRPIVLVTDSYVPAPTAQVLKTVGAQRTVVAGGTATVPDSVMNQLPSPTRLGGQSRYEVSASVASWARGKIPVSSVLVSSGVQMALADTLSGGQLGRPTLYVNSLVVPAPVASWLDTSPDLSKVTVLGGSASVPDRVAGRAQQAALQ